MSDVTIDRDAIAATFEVIRPHVRRTPVLETDGADFGLEDCRVLLKLELLQHVGVFKTRGAFANLLLRDVPAAGVVAASGGNHGAAVAYAAMKRRVPAKFIRYPDSYHGGWSPWNMVHRYHHETEWWHQHLSGAAASSQ